MVNFRNFQVKLHIFTVLITKYDEEHGAKLGVIKNLSNFQGKQQIVLIEKIR